MKSNPAKISSLKSSFTLIELLVVIAIIGIISGLIIVTLGGATDSANDARRKSDISALKKALAIYSTLNGMAYPVQSTPCNIRGATNPCSTLASAISDNLPTLPVDPNGQYYRYASDGTTYGILSQDALSDIDGNKYDTVSIGNQTWMAENLMTTKYRDGTGITRGPSDASWTGDLGYYAYPPNTGNTAEETLANIQSNKLGFVYQLSAVNSSHGLCPAGWHVPTDAEWCTLEQYVDPSISCSTTSWRGTNGGLKLKEEGTTHWTSHANVGTNASMFSAVGSGYRGTTGSFNSRSTSTRFWASGASGWYRSLNYSYATVYRSTNSAAYGFSVRCLKD